VPQDRATAHRIPDKPVPQWVKELLERFTSLWWEAGDAIPPLGPTFTRHEQSCRESHIDRFLDTLMTELERPPRTPSEYRAAQERILSVLAISARKGLGWEDRHLDVLLTGGFTQAATEFVQMARRFDPNVSGADIFQAGRNALAMNGLQLLLGLPVRLTPAIFAYSMLYPYTDNYLDDPTVSTETKRAFNERLGRRLWGEDVTPANAQERRIHDLVGMIESQFERARHPRVFECLLAIHRAQIKSVGLLCRGASPYEVDVLGISFEKGGASVLADGYLVAGSLSQVQGEFLFGWGTFLQLADDLQDVERDCQDGLLTVFSQTAGRWPLDAVTNRTFHFRARVLEGMGVFDARGTEPLKELMRSSGTMLLISAVGHAGRFYSKRYLRGLESHSPFRFSFLRKSHKRLARQRTSMMKMLEAFAPIAEAERSGAMVRESARRYV